MPNINYQSGNLLDVTSGLIVHGCNAQGVMGSGIALQLKQRYPGMFSQYVEDVNRWSHQGTQRHLCMGKVSWYFHDDLVIASCITQKFYGKDGAKYVSYDAIDECASEIDDITSIGGLANVDHIHLPKIGAGLGGGSWDVIAEILKHRISLPITCWIRND